MDAVEDPSAPATVAAASRGRIRPIYALLAAVAAGIAIALYAPLPIGSLLLAAALLLIGASLLLFAGRPAPHPAAGWLLLAPFLLVGMLRAEQASALAPDDISHWIGAPPPVCIRGWALPGVRSRTSRLAPDAFTATFSLDVQSLTDTQGVTHPAEGRLRVVALDVLSAPRAGDPLQIRGAVQAPQPATNPGGFDERSYLKRQRIYAVLTARRQNLMRLPGPTAALPLWETAADALRTGLDRVARENLSPDDADLLGGMLSSQRDRLPPALETAFTRTGTVHLVSFSGIHVAVLAALLLWLLHRATVPRKAARLIAIGAVWIFALAASTDAAGGGIRTPALRAALCATVFLAAPLLRRTAESRHALAFAALVLLLLDPLALTDPGAQLTFATVGALIGWMPPLERLLVPWEPSMDLRRRICRRAVLGLTGGLVALAGAAPVAAYHFHQISAVSPVANLVLAPLADLLLVAGLVLSALPILPLWGVLAAGLHLLRTLAFAFAAPDWAAWNVAAPPALVVLLYYVLLGALSGYVRRRVLTPPRLFSPAPPAAGAAAA